jgi:hypothetical protein
MSAFLVFLHEGFIQQNCAGTGVVHYDKRLTINAGEKLFFNPVLNPSEVISFR